MGRNASKKPMKYEVEKIIDRCYSGTEVQYFIKWKGFGNTENTWVSAKDCDCPDLIKEFEEEQKLKKSGDRYQNFGPRAKRNPVTIKINNKTKTDKPRKRCRILNDYVKRAANIPSFQEYSDRDECISAPENYKLLTDSEMKLYVLACEAKFKGDTHNAFVHLSANGYSIQKALETIDNPDSSPMKHLRENLGIWTEDELKNFARLILDNVQIGDKIKKHSFWLEETCKRFPNKSRVNCLNLYYTLKSAGFSFKNGSYNKTSQFLLKSSTIGCPNCVNKLWKHENQQNEENLCGLCKLYFQLYRKHRPNANGFSHPFDLSVLSSNEK